MVKDGDKPNPDLVHGGEAEVLGQVLCAGLLARDDHVQEDRPDHIMLEDIYSLVRSSYVTIKPVCDDTQNLNET